MFFKPENKTELQVAVDAWILNLTAAAMENGDINCWDTSLVTDMSFLFDEASSFNHSLSNWNTADVVPLQPTNFSDIGLAALRHFGPK
jgi:hypothetical protein